MAPQQRLRFEVAADGRVLLFEHALSRTLRCPIHDGLLRTPVIAPCGHSFCQECILQHLNASEACCPIDRSTVSGDGCLIPNLAVEEQLQELRVHCTNGMREAEAGGWEADPEGCQELLPLYGGEEHEASCPFGLVQCPACGRGPMRRLELEEHSGSCAERPCAYAFAGCPFVGEKEDIADHLKNGCAIAPIGGYVEHQEGRLREMEALLRFHRDENEQLRGRLLETQQQLEQLAAMVEANGQRFEGGLRFATSALEEMRGQLDENTRNVAALTKVPAAGPIVVRDMGRGMQMGPAKQNFGQSVQVGGRVAGVPGMNITVHGTFQGHTGPVWALAVAEGLLISGSSDETVKIWGLATYECRATLRGHTGIVHAVAANHRHVISGSSDKLIKVWEMDTGNCIRTLDHHQNTVCSILVAGGYIFSGSFMEIRVFNADTYAEAVVLTGHSHWVRAMVVQDNFLYSGSHNIIKVYNVDNFQCTETIRSQCGSIYSLAVTEDKLLAGVYENLVYVWDVKSYEIITTLHQHQGAVYNLCVYGDKFFSASYDTTIRVWSLETLRCIQTIGQHTSSVEALCLSGGYLFSGSADALIKAWR